MKLKNKLFLVLIATIFAICLFNTNCFATSNSFVVKDYKGTEHTWTISEELLQFKYIYFLYDNNSSGESYWFFVSDYELASNSSSKHQLTFKDKNNTGTYYAKQKQMFTRSAYDTITEEFSTLSIDDMSAETGVYNTGIDDGSLNCIYSNSDYYSSNGTLLLPKNLDLGSVERGTNDNTNPDSGETGNETTGGDSETDTDSDDSSGILSSIKKGFENVVNFFTQLIDFVGNILSYLNPFSDNFILKGVLNFLSEILSYINPFSENFFVYKLIDLLGDLLKFLFIPNENSFTGIIDIVKSKFDFIDTIKISANSLKDLISNVGTAPKLTINVNNNKYGVEQITLIDLEWYKPYKPYGDLVLTGFIYAFFLWRFFISVPNILNGFGGAVQNSYETHEIRGGKKL